MDMNIRRKVGMGAAALIIALPLSFVAALAGPTLLASAGGVQDPVMCNISGSATFTPPLTKAGVNTGKGSTESVKLTGFSESNCLSSSSDGPPASGSIPTQTISIAATKVGSGKTAQYLTGYCPGFASTNSLKALKGLTLTSSWSGGEGSSTSILTKPAGIAANNLGEAGFAVPAKVVGGKYPSKVAQVIVYLTVDESNALGTFCAGGPVGSITFDPSTSTVIQ